MNFEKLKKKEKIQKEIFENKKLISLVVLKKNRNHNKFNIYFQIKRLTFNQKLNILQ